MFSEMPLSVMFVLFLLFFVLVGIYPLWKQAGVKYRRLRATRARRSTGPVAPHVVREQPQFDATQLSTYEYFVLRRLAQSPHKGLSHRRLAAELHFNPAMVRRALRSLARRGMISLGFSLLPGARFMLSEAGRRHAQEQGYIVHLGGRR